jgi:hypothetical protein
MRARFSHFLVLTAAALIPAAAIQAQATPPKITFSNAQKSAVSSVTGGLQLLAAGDVNGDGNTDLIVLPTNGGSNLSGLQLLLGDGKGGFSLTKTTGLPTCNNCGYSNVQLVDLNADGKLDLVVINWGTLDTDSTGQVCGRGPGSLTLYVGDGKGAFKQSYSTALSEVARSSVIADFNNDGKPDFAFYSTVSGAACYPNAKSLEIFLNNGNGTLGAPHSVAIPQVQGAVAVAAAVAAPTNKESGTMLDDLTSGDFNHDGNVDLALIRFDTTTGNFTKIIDVLNGKGDGTFSGGPIYTFAERPIALAGADFNHDGRTDLVVTLANDAAGTFRIATLLAKQTTGFYWSSATAYKTTYVSLALADFNADGNLDLLSTPGTNYLPFAVFANYGNGSFPAPVTLSVASTGTNTTDPIFAVPLKTGAKPSLIAGTPHNGGTGLPNPAFVIVFANLTN